MKINHGQSRGGEQNVTSADSQLFLEDQDDLSKWAPSNG